MRDGYEYSISHRIISCLELSVAFILFGNCASFVFVEMNNQKFGIFAGQTVLLIWNTGNSVESLENVVKEIQNVLGTDGKVKVENVERLHLGKLYVCFN